MRLLRNETGASIIAAVLLIAIITIAGLVFVSLFTTGIEESIGNVGSARALYIAEAGAEAAIGHLKKTPVSANWTWRDGYLNRTVGAGTADVEVLQYEVRDSTLAGPSRCEQIESTIVAAGENPSRTVYATLAWTSASDMGLELYDNTVADCNNPTASANLLASSLTAKRPETVRYRIQAAAPATLTYTVRVVGTAGDVYRLRIAHPDETGFSPADMRAVIALGKSGKARRETFSGISRTP